MTDPTIASDISFSTNDRASIRAVFLAHLTRFVNQGRETAWRRAPWDFARVYGDNFEDTDTTMRLFRSAMEDLLDSGEIRVERLADGGNRLTAVING